MTNTRSWILSAFFGVLMSASIGAASSQAREFRHVPAGDWHTGHWVHDRHGGRLGWWWVVGPSWAYYARPHSFVVVAPPQTVVVQQVPIEQPPVMIQQAPPPQIVTAAPPVSPVLYYCKATGTHYPETMSCPGGWSTMTAETPPQPMGPQ